MRQTSATTDKGKIEVFVKEEGKANENESRFPQNEMGI